MTAYEFRGGETPFASLARIVAQQTLATAEHLRDCTVTLETRIHDTRKRFKEIRALLRVFRTALGEEQFTIENQWYRDAARELADYRDADATVAAIENLRAEIKQSLGRRAMRQLRRIAIAERTDAYDDNATAEARVANIAQQLPIAGARCGSVTTLAEPKFGLIESDLLRALRIGRRAMRKAFATRQSADFHEWRKRVKDHWHHVQLLAPVAGRKLLDRNAQLDELSHLLGDHHDLDVIRGMVATAEATFVGAEARRVDEVLAREQRRLEAKAKKVAKRIYSKDGEAVMTKAAQRWKKVSRAKPQRALHLVPAS